MRLSLREEFARCSPQSTPCDVWADQIFARTVGSMKTLAILAILLSLVSASPAKVLVYKGTFVSKTGPVGIRPSSGKCFMVFNPDSQQIAFVTFLRMDGEKILDVGSPTDIQVASAEILQGRSATTISLNTGGVSELPSFANGIFYFRGTD